MEALSENASSVSPSAPAPVFYSLSSIITFILLPPLWFLSVPAIIFSKEAKAMYKAENFELYLRFSQRTRRFILSAWAVFLTLALSVLALLLTIRLSLI